MYNQPMNKNPFETYKHIHFIGIGGIGVSAVARMFHMQGKKVTGSDMSQSEITDDLKKEGIEIYIGHSEEQVGDDVDLMVYTIAIPETNPELQIARGRGIRTMTYPEVLGELSKTMYTIAVAGTHGKTTTTAMIAHILEQAGLEPTVIVGSKLIGKETNFIVGNGKYLVVEACEYRRSFLNLYPSALIITNIETDHLDYYKDLADIQDAFKTLVERVPHEGYVICATEDKNVAPVLEHAKAHVVDYEKESNDIQLSVPGLHNRQNANAAFLLGMSLGVDTKIAHKALEDFKGTWRRLEYKGNILGSVPLYDDYAHHPTAIKAGIAAIRESYPEHRLVCVFEPHHQQRVRDFADEFALALSRADKVFIAPIYRTREAKDESLADDMLANMIDGAKAVHDPAELEHELKKENNSRTVVLMMGAGKMHDWALHILKNMGSTS